MARKTLAAFTLASVKQPEGQRAGQTKLAQLRAISPDVVTAMIAAGPLDTNDDFVYATIVAYVDAHGARQAARDQVAAAIKGHRNAGDALAELEIEGADAGYVLGLAVGLALGNGNPFGGAR